MPGREHALQVGGTLFHTRPACVAAIGTLTGVLLALSLSVDTAVLAASLLLLLAVLAHRFRMRARALLLLCCVMGLLRACFAALPDAPAYSGTLTGRVCTEAVDTARGVRVDLSGVSIGGARLRGRLRVYLPGADAPENGRVITVRGQVVPPNEKQRTAFRAARVCGVVFAYSPDFRVHEDAGDPLSFLYACRRQVRARVLALFPENGGAAAAMLLGDKSEVDEDTRAAFERAGILHLMAASGLHVSILAGAATALVRRGRWRRFVFSVLFLAVYAFLTAFSPSVLRAAIMFLIYQLAGVLRRRPDSPSSLSAAFLVLVLCRPYALLGAGFQLSFLAAFGIVVLAPAIKPRFRFLGETAGGIVAGSVAVTAATLPPMARMFGELSLTALIANIFVLPLAPLFLIPAFLAAVLSYVLPPLGVAAAFLAKLPLGAIVAVARLGADASIAVPAPGLAAYLFYLAAIVCISPLCMARGSRRALFACGALALSLLCWHPFF